MILLPLVFQNRCKHLLRSPRLAPLAATAAAEAAAVAAFVSVAAVALTFLTTLIWKLCRLGHQLASENFNDPQHSTSKHHVFQNLFTCLGC